MANGIITVCRLRALSVLSWQKDHIARSTNILARSAGPLNREVIMIKYNDTGKIQLATPELVPATPLQKSILNEFMALDNDGKMWWLLMAKEAIAREQQREAMAVMDDCWEYE